MHILLTIIRLWHFSLAETNVACFFKDFQIVLFNSIESVRIIKILPVAWWRL